MQAEGRPTIDIIAVGRHIEAASRARRAACAAGGAALVTLAFVLRGVAGVALALGGVALIARGMTGRSLRATARRALRTFRARSEEERVNQASLESFPASDPPAYSPKR